MMTYLPEVSLYCQDPDKQDLAYQLSNQFQIPLVQVRRSQEWQLCLTEKGIELFAPEILRFKSFIIDFQDKKLNKRRQELGAKNNLAKAIGHQVGKIFNIVDMTAGLGRDAFLMAALGHHVILVEQNPVLAMMLQDALDRALLSEVAPIIKRMKLIWADSRVFFKQSGAELLAILGNMPDVIYIDPMFPERDKTALVKKDMQILQHIIGHGQDNDYLLDLALANAKRRVVVKRPRVGEFLEGKAPDLQFVGKTQRFDVYLIN